MKILPIKRIGQAMIVLAFLSGCTATTTQSSVETKSTKDSSLSSESRTETTSRIEMETTESSVTFSTHSENDVSSPTIEDFVGGWGVPNSGLFFFINPDFTQTSAEGLTSPLDLSFSTTEDGRFIMTNTVNGEEFSSILEPDGTLTASDGTTLTYLGNYDYHGWLKMKDEEMKQAENAEPIITTPDQAIELAKKYMFQDDDSYSDSYHFEAFDIEESAYRPYYSVNIRQKAQNGFKSMHIGWIRVYTDNGECEWE